MRWEMLKKQVRSCLGATGGRSRTLYAFPLGPLEIVLIVVAVILVFGVGKLSQVGGALGKSIREFRKEKDSLGDNKPKLTTRETQKENSIRESEVKSEAKSEEESKD